MVKLTRAQGNTILGEGDIKISYTSDTLFLSFDKKVPIYVEGQEGTRKNGSYRLALSKEDLKHITKAIKERKKADKQIRQAIKERKKANAQS